MNLIVTGGGLSVDGKRWSTTDPKSLMYHDGLKKRWKYQISTRMKKAHREGQWRFPKSKDFLKQYPLFAAMINKLWNIPWYAYIGASLLDPRFSVQYIGQKASGVLEYWNVGILGKSRNIQPQHSIIPPFHHSRFSFPMIRYAGLFSNRWKKQYLSQARIALNEPDPDNCVKNTPPSWTERQTDYTGINPLVCPNCDEPLTSVGAFLGNWNELQCLFDKAGKDPFIPSVLLRPG